MADALLSVLIPCRNRAIYLVDCLNSIRAEEAGMPVEVIVLDDGSEEDIGEVCAGFPDVNYIRQEHRGVSAARNRLLAEASGEYVSFLDADDLFVPEKLRLQAKYLREHPDCPYVGCNVMSFHGAVPEKPYRKNEPAGKFLVPCMFRRSVFEAVGPFDERLTVSEDTEYLARIKQKGFTGEHCLDEVLYLRRLKDDTSRVSDREKDLRDLAVSILRARKNAAGHPQVSMIVPCYNAKEYIAEFLQSVIKQTYRPLQLILVDDGSTDGTGSIIQSFLPLIDKAGINTCFLPCEHRNQSAALNEGLKYCTGKYLTWADCDDLLAPENIGAKAEFLEHHPELGMVRNAAELLENGSRSPIPSKSQTGATGDIFSLVLQEQITTVAGCFMMRLSLFRECWPEGRITVSSLGQNLQLILPAAGRSHCGFLPEVLMTYRVHNDSHSRRTRSTREVLERIEELRRVLKEGVLRSGRDPEKYFEEADIRCNALRQSLVRAIMASHCAKQAAEERKTAEK